MSSSVGIAIFVLVGLMVAAVMRQRAVARLKPVIEAVARKHKATIIQSFLGMPQITKVWNGHAMRLTPMTISTSSAEGGGEMTSVDFDWPGKDAGAFRLREKPDAKRNAVPVVLMGDSTPLTLGNPQLNQRYSAAGINPGEVLRILGNARVAESLVSLPAGADVQVRGGRCYVTVKGHPSGVEDVDRLFATAELLLEASVDLQRRT